VNNEKSIISSVKNEPTIEFHHQSSKRKRFFYFHFHWKFSYFV